MWGLVKATTRARFAVRRFAKIEKPLHWIEQESQLIHVNGDEAIALMEKSRLCKSISICVFVTVGRAPRVEYSSDLAPVKSMVKYLKQPSVHLQNH